MGPPAGQPLHGFHFPAPQQLTMQHFLVVIEIDANELAPRKGNGPFQDKVQ